MPKRPPSIPPFKPPRMPTVNVPASVLRVPGAPRKRAMEPAKSKPAKRPSRAAPNTVRSPSRERSRPHPNRNEQMGEEKKRR